MGDWKMKKKNFKGKRENSYKQNNATNKAKQQKQKTKK